MNRRYNHRGGVNNGVLAVITIILVLILVVLLIWNHQQAKAETARLQGIQDRVRAEEQAIQAALKEKEANDSFYQKLADGFDTNILIVGDSIGAGSGTETDGKQWFTQLQSYLRSTYKVDVNLTNVSMGGNTVVVKLFCSTFG